MAMLLGLLLEELLVSRPSEVLLEPGLELLQAGLLALLPPPSPMLLLVLRLLVL